MNIYGTFIITNCDKIPEEREHNFLGVKQQSSTEAVGSGGPEKRAFELRLETGEDTHLVLLPIPASVALSEKGGLCPPYFPSIPIP